MRSSQVLKPALEAFAGDRRFVSGRTFFYVGRRTLGAAHAALRERVRDGRRGDASAGS